MKNRRKHIQPRIAPTVSAHVVTLDIESIPARPTSAGDLKKLRLSFYQLQK